jgi:hypothetical protein
MFKGFIDKFYHRWQGRFTKGIAFSLVDLAVNRFSNGEYIGTVHVGCIVSNNTGHWPWYVFEIGYCTGPLSVWHVGLLGFTVGITILHDIDTETGEIVGPDKKKYYWFFKGFNHKDKQLEEII